MVQPPSSPPAPDSPSRDRDSESPPPGVPGDVEMELLGLANALYNLGTTVISDLTKEREVGEKKVGDRVNDVISHLGTIERLSDNVRTIVPMQVLGDIDNSRNPRMLTKDRIERVASDNQLMNAKINALEAYRNDLADALSQNFPDIAPYVRPGAQLTAPMPPAPPTSQGNPPLVDGSSHANGMNGAESSNGGIKSGGG